jgi:predicted RNase H-like HicB family nuclease
MVAMKALIRLHIEKIEEQGQEYFVATSDELQGLVAQGDTLKEVIAIAEDVARILLELEAEQCSHSLKREAMPQNFEYPLIIEV